jgi:DNA replication and repair protein RecF
VRLVRLRLHDFRNYTRLEAEFPPGIVLLTGPNGAGKSNLLEAIHYLSYLKSFRGARDRDVLRHGAQYAVVDAELLDDHERPFDVRLVLKGGKRFVRLNGSAVTRFQDFIGRLHSQFFFPGDLSLLTGDPALRREVLDLELLRLKPQLTAVLRGYAKALAERNNVLKRMHPGPGARPSGRNSSDRERAEARAPSELSQALATYTAQLITTGTQVLRERRGLVRVLDTEFTRLYASLAPEGGETASLRYVSGIELDPDAGIPAAFTAALAGAADAEANLRYTTVGPHRDDLGFLLDGKRDMRRYASQGQLRSAALCFRLALCLLSARRLSDDPLLLLDDALSEMDDARKDRLLQLCRRQRQVFITSASEREAQQVLPLASAVLRVEAGTVSQQ